MRVVSERPVKLKSGEVGYIHQLTSHTATTPMVRKQEPEPVINCGALMEKWHQSTLDSMIIEQAKWLGVTPYSLHCLGMAYAPEYRAFAFPMFDGHMNMVGIRLRSVAGKKWAVRGSHQGIFAPNINPFGGALVCEGPTDVAAAITLGYYAVGRPSCSGGAQAIKDLFRQIGVRMAIIVSDNDEPGLNGAEMMARHIGVPSCILVPPAKDLRAYVKAGGDKRTLDSLIKGQVWLHGHLSSSENGSAK